MTEIFAVQFKLLNESFQETFLELFGGGKATLELEDPNDILNCGIDISYSTTRSFKVIEDLLGADHILDLDYYLLDDATYSNNLQNNLQNPNRKVTEGERFGYDYRLTRRSAALRGVVEWQHNNNLCLARRMLHHAWQEALKVLTSVPV